MAHFWLTPVISREPLTLGAERMKCIPVTELALFRQVMDTVHPWLLPLFKANLLLSDGIEDSCGAEGEELNLFLADARDIVFDTNPYVLSHCAGNFLERLLRIEQTKQGLREVEAINQELWTDSQQLWLEQMHIWLASGKEVIIIREEEY